jgi:hypothetical protein
MYTSPASCHFLLDPNILLSTPFSNILNLCYALSVTDQVKHPYKTRGKIILVFILILKFLVRRWEDKVLNRMVAIIPRI